MAVGVTVGVAVGFGVGVAVGASDEGALVASSAGDTAAGFSVSEISF